jgi:hypothetical protein
MAWRQGAATVWLRRDKLLIAAVSLARGARLDWRGIWTGLPVVDFEANHSLILWSDPDCALGEALRAALNSSRINIPRPAAWDRGIGSDDAEFGERLAKLFGLKGSRSLYSNMLGFGAERVANRVTLYPSRRRRGGPFEAFDQNYEEGQGAVRLLWKVSDDELGSAIRRCVGRCR